jgi:hypothetical protein
VIKLVSVKELKERQGIVLTQIDIFETFITAHPSINAFNKMLGLLKPVEPLLKVFGNFFGIISQGIQEGLSDSVHLLAETLFKPENINNMRDLGVAIGDLIGEIVTGLVPALRLLNPAIEGFNTIIERVTQFITDPIGALGEVLDFLGDAFGVFWDWLVRGWEEAWSSWDFGLIG